RSQVVRCHVDRLAYHLNVRHSTLFLSLIFLLSTVHAQVPGAPPTGTVRPYTGPVQPPTAAPVLTRPRGFATPGFAPNGSHAHMHHDGGIHHHDPYPYLGYGEIYGYGVPYAYADDPNAADQGYDVTDDSNYQGGPTVFDRRGSGAQSYVPPVERIPTPHAEQATDHPATEPQPVQPLTVLVFKDGHKLEVGNYAIVGATLFDMTPGHPRKIALADLDLDATQKQNDDRGVVFQLPLQAS
ncbi:MAG TPA: hypothetical protein VE866_07140, partial [Candidatus Binatia bacterium]|nr:hypothetical protein [Candidatus Binatia bacterium]